MTLLLVIFLAGVWAGVQNTLAQQARTTQERLATVFTAEIRRLFTCRNTTGSS